MQAGDPAGPRVLLLGLAFPVGVRLWEPQIQAFPGWRLMRPALPGFDGSALIDDVSIDAYARHVLARLDELRIDRAVFGGVSMGGHLTLAVLRQAPGRVADVILADTRSTAGNPEALEGRRRLLETLDGGGPAAVVDDLEAAGKDNTGAPTRHRGAGPGHDSRSDRREDCRGGHGPHVSS